MKIVEEKIVEKIEVPKETWAVLIVEDGDEHMVYFVDFTGDIFSQVRVQDEDISNVVRAISHMVKVVLSPMRMFDLDCKFTTNRIFEPDVRPFDQPNAWSPGFEFLQIIRHLSFCKNVLGYENTDEFKQTKTCVDNFVSGYRVPIELKDESLHEKEVKARKSYIKELEKCIW